jgi:GNAT superfamily N-acetyltransferase
VISDRTLFAYILDVIVSGKFRRQGIGQAMINHILAHHDLKNVYQWMLTTKDAHGVYRKAGFNPIARSGDWMEIRHNRPERLEKKRAAGFLKPARLFFIFNSFETFPADCCLFSLSGLMILRLQDMG